MTTALQSFDRSTLKAFKASALKARGSTNALPIIGLRRWIPDNYPNGSYMRTDNPWNTKTSEFIGSYPVGTRGTFARVTRTGGTTQPRQRWRSIFRNYAAANKSIVNPYSPTVPSTITLKCIFDVVSAGSARLKVHAVNTNDDVSSLANYQLFTTELADIDKSVVASFGNYTSVSINVATYVATITASTWALMFSTHYDATDTEPSGSSSYTHSWGIIDAQLHFTYP